MYGEIEWQGERIERQAGPRRGGIMGQREPFSIGGNMVPERAIRYRRKEPSASQGGGELYKVVAKEIHFVPEKGMCRRPNVLTGSCFVPPSRLVLYHDRLFVPRKGPEEQREPLYTRGKEVTLRRHSVPVKRLVPHREGPHRTEIDITVTREAVSYKSND